MSYHSVHNFRLFVKMQKYKTVYCFCGCETWSVTLQEEHRLRVLEYRVLRNVLVINP
jgi:hypothetical protein